MSVSKNYMDKFFKIKTNLTNLDNQPLSKAALVIILFLDIFVLTSIYNGLDEHVNQFSSPDEYIPHSCREIVIDKDWNSTNRIDNLSDIIISHSNSYYQIEEEKKIWHPVCAPYLDLFDQIKNNEKLAIVFEERSKIGREARALQRKIGNLKGGYDTSLLETIADQEEGQADIGIIKKDIRVKTNDLNTLRRQIAGLERKINRNENVKLLWKKLQGLQQADREKLKADLRSIHFWYPIKELGMQMVFLLPLFAVFYVWNNASIGKNRGIQTLVSSHLMVVSFIPILCRITETVYDIIPKKLLKKLTELLESLKLVAIWYYLVIALAVAAALFVIYIFQKKLFSREKLAERRIAKGQCQECGKQLPPGSQACSFCGYAQFKTCSSCNKSTFTFGKYCRECGKVQ